VGTSVPRGGVWMQWVSLPPMLSSAPVWDLEEQKNEESTYTSSSTPEECDFACIFQPLVKMNIIYAFVLVPGDMVHAHCCGTLATVPTPAGQPGLPLLNLHLRRNTTECEQPYEIWAENSCKFRLCRARPPQCGGSPALWLWTVIAAHDIWGIRSCEWKVESIEPRIDVWKMSHNLLHLECLSWVEGQVEPI
jgi:hypothetical protein